MKKRIASEEAYALHEQYPPIDLHADTLMWSRWIGYDLHTRHDPPLPRSALGGHVDVPRLKEAGFGAQFFGLVSLPMGKTRGLVSAIHQQIDALERTIHSRHGLKKVWKHDDVDRVKKQGSVGAFLGIEGAHALEGHLENLESFAKRGVRYLGLAHFSANEACFPAYGWGSRPETGLTPWGRELVQKCEELNVIVDLAHINRKGFHEACDLMQKPPIISHTGVLGAFDHWRNVDNAQLRRVADMGGCVGVIFCPQFLGGDGLQPVVKHIQHIVDVCGEDTPALGSDWDGFIVPTRGLHEASMLPSLTEALLATGMSERAIGKILCLNVKRVLQNW